MLSILIIPAASALPLTYRMVVAGVSAHGYDIRALHLPSIGLPKGPRPGKPPSMYDDAAYISDQVTELANEGHDILLIAHSYGGAPATEAVNGLSKAERKREGKRGGIVGLAYMGCLVPGMGEPASSGPWSPLMEIGEDGWFYYPDEKTTAKIFFSDLPLDQGLYWASKMVRHSAASFISPLIYTGYKDVPVSYLITEGDKSIPPRKQRSQIRMIEQASGRRVDVSTTTAGHVPSLTAPSEVINWILAVASKLDAK
ncbi:unnamed protein product [Clonostachys rhizophaga]|uniref:AB hydrolase-1 domain-containing protein n=1 Tax=Clonostachys rhizophaga TaxID=160324 RepID=A0A9N9V6Z6_9HYPO|nr:unnamed protein product [Clonostachys rhizophaga]